MSEPIKAGDLVIVIRGQHCCGGTGRSLGKIRSVTEIRHGMMRCRECNARHERTYARTSVGKSYDISRLKRIPPLSELEGERTKEDLREPA
jgi:hypothetical protein